MCVPFSWRTHHQVPTVTHRVTVACSRLAWRFEAAKMTPIKLAPAAMAQEASSTRRTPQTWQTRPQRVDHFHGIFYSDFNGILMGFLWILYGISMDFYGFYGFLIVIQWDIHGIYPPVN